MCWSFLMQGWGSEGLSNICEPLLGLAREGGEVVCADGVVAQCMVG